MLPIEEDKRETDGQCKILSVEVQNSNPRRSTYLRLLEINRIFGRSM
jgi:hypothetical protein